jgi:acetyltransferase-like isoleucine patch superfamily enzyme
MKLISRIFRLFLEKRLFYLWSGSKVTIEKGAVFQVGKNVAIRNSTIYVKKGDKLIIGDNSIIDQSSISMITGKENYLKIGQNSQLNEYNLNLIDANVAIGDYNILQKGNKETKSSFTVSGQLVIGDFNRLRCSIWIRFNGNVVIGSRNAINEGTEIRSDEEIKIGDYNQISYDCMIWDTNTHSLYKADKRREITDRQYPDFGLEYEKPHTKPVFIGNDCWVGKGASVLKGSRVEDRCIVGYGTLLSNISIPENKIIINEPNLKLIDNQL